MVLTNKNTIRVTIFTRDHRIEGEMHILEGSRLTDALNAKSKDYYAITDAKIHRLDNDQLVATPDYVAVSRESIFTIFPME